METDLKTLKQMFDESNRVKDLITKDWDKARDMIRGDQMPADRPAHKPPAVLNMMRPMIERKTAMLTDTKPRFTVQPTRTGDRYANASKILDDTANAWWDDSSIDMVLARALLYAQAFGTLVTQTRWSTSAADVVLDCVDPRMFYVDPYVASADQVSGAEYVILEETPTMAEMKMRFPDAGRDLKAWSPPVDQAKEGAASRIWKRITGPPRFSAGNDSGSPTTRALIRHYWVKDYTTEQVEITMADAKADTKPRLISRRRYPGGRYVVWGYGGSKGEGIILHDKPNPYWDLVHPFDMMEWYMDLDGPWGDSEVQANQSPQLLLNKIAEVIVENAMLMNNAIWIADQNAFPADEGPKGWGQLTNAPGAIIKKRPGTELKREYPSGIPSTLMSMAQHLEQFLDRSSGMTDMQTKGKAGQMQTGLGVEQLMQASSAMIRLKARALENMIQRIGQKFISRVFQFYTNDRIFHVRGASDEFLEYQFIRESLHTAIGAEALRDAHRDFRFRVAPGSSLSMTKIQKGLIAVQLYQMGAIDRQAVLESVEFPDWRAILQRTIKEQALGVEPAGQQKGKKPSKRGNSALERQHKVAGRI